MPDLPRHEIGMKTIHEFTIGVEEKPTDAKTFRYGLRHVYSELERLGVDLEYDDAFHVRAGDGGEIVIYFERGDD